MNPIRDEPPRFEHVACVDSTNATLLQRPFATAPAPPALLLADAQTAGRGRLGRRWLSDPQASLTLSLALEQRAGAAPLLGLPVAVGVAIAEELARHGAPCLLKWPNDLYCTPTVRPTPGRLAKAGGILVEIRQHGAIQRIVIGCGLNLSDAQPVTEGATGQPVAALFAAGVPPAREALARSLGAAMLQAWRDFVAQGLRPFVARWRALDCLAGRAIDVHHVDGTREAGVALGIDDTGALRVTIGGEVRTLLAGEVSVRRH